MRSVYFLPLLFIAFEACVDPVQIEFIPEPQKLVVDGMITSDPGPYEIKLSYTVGFDAVSLKKPALNSGASLWIYDDLGNFEKLTEVSTGIYQTSKTGIQGKVGREYYLKIKTRFGREYQSIPQMMEAPGEITNVSFQYEAEGLKGNEPDEYIDALKVLLDSKGTEKGNNLFRWRWNTVFEARTFPELRLGQAAGPPFPAPEPCSGYVRDGDGTNPPAIRKVAECTCCTCWPNNYSTASNISHNRIIDGYEFKSIDLGNIPAETQQFYVKYYIKVEQLSLSEEAYEFWNLVEKQQSGLGDLFQPSSVKVRGNIQSITDPDEEVLGLFGVSGIAKKELYLTADLVPRKLPLDTIKHACSDSFKSVLPAKPSFW